MTWLPYNDDVLQFAGEKISKTTLGFEMLSEPKRKMIKHIKAEEVKTCSTQETWEMKKCKTTTESKEGKNSQLDMGASMVNLANYWSLHKFRWKWFKTLY